MAQIHTARMAYMETTTFGRTSRLLAAGEEPDLHFNEELVLEHTCSEHEKPVVVHKDAVQSVDWARCPGQGRLGEDHVWMWDKISHPGVITWQDLGKPTDSGFPQKALQLLVRLI